MSATIAHALHGTSGPPVTLVHGALVATPSWRFQLPGLDARVLAADQRGYGETPYGGPEDGIATMAADLVALWEALDIERTVVVGFSMGTMVALDAAALAPERVAGLVLVSGGALTDAAREVFAQRSAELAGDDFEATVSEHVRRAFSAAYVEAHPDEIDAYAAHARTADPRAVAQTFASIAAWRLPAGLPDVPTLLINGSEDGLFTPAAAAALAAQLPDATARTEVVAGAGHTLHFERPDLFNPLVERFAAEVAP